MIAPDVPLKNLGTLSEEAAPPLTPWKSHAVSAGEYAASANTYIAWSSLVEQGRGGSHIVLDPDPSLLR